jgi:hypothetical protein
MPKKILIFLIIFLIVFNFLFFNFRKPEQVLADSSTWQITVNNSNDCLRQGGDYDYFSINETSQEAGNDSIPMIPEYIEYGGGMRFTNITIPRNSIINSAYLNFRADVSRTTVTVNTRIRGQASDDADTFFSMPDYDARPRTAEYVNWNSISAWTAGTWYQSPDISLVIKKIIDRSGWTSGNDLVLFWDDNNSTPNIGRYRSAYSFDGSSTNAPQLVINWTPPLFPTVSTLPATNITSSGATLNGSIDNIGGENADLRGFEWGTVQGVPYPNSCPDPLPPGSYGTGAFSCDISGLTPGNTYYFRAKAHNSYGWGYGGPLSFAIPNNVSGWAWSENIGWISFNSTNCQGSANCLCPSLGGAGCPNPSYPCSNSSCADLKTYGVIIDPSTGDFSGHAWSENIGWISFNSADLAGCPSGTCKARLDTTPTGSVCDGTGVICGWARALSYGGGWDGWIRLRGDEKISPLKLRPIGSSSTELTPNNCTSNWECVDEETVNDSDYVSTSSGAWRTDLYRLPVAVSSGAINKVTVKYRAWQSGPFSGAGAEAVIKKISSGNKSYSSYVSLPSSATDYSWVVDKDPDGEPWTWEAINDLEVGIALLAASPTSARVSQVYVEVDANYFQYGVWLKPSDPSPKELRGWAWGSDVVGWISFNHENTKVATDYNVKTSLDFAPTADTLSIDEDDFVNTLCGQTAGARVRFKWRFIDSDGSQSAYQIQVDDDSDFSSPQPAGDPDVAVGGFDTGKVVSNSNKFINNSPYPLLSWGASYYWRLMVWDNQNTPSGWVIYPGSFLTSAHSWPFIDFDWTPTVPNINEDVPFTDKSLEYTTNPVGVACTIATCSWSWQFLPDGIPDDPTLKDPTTKFPFSGLKNIKLTVTDSEGFYCVGSKDLTVGLPSPYWKEIPPPF